MTPCLHWNLILIREELNSDDEIKVTQQTYCKHKYECLYPEVYLPFALLKCKTKLQFDLLKQSGQLVAHIYL